jgi:hypothetical protein
VGENQVREAGAVVHPQVVVQPRAGAIHGNIKLRVPGGPGQQDGQRGEQYMAKCNGYSGQRVCYVFRGKDAKRIGNKEAKGLAKGSEKCCIIDCYIFVGVLVFGYLC